MTEQVVRQVKGCLADYLRQQGISLRRNFRCLNPDHEDIHPSMSYHPGKDYVHCFSCGATYDLFDLIGLDYSLDTFLDQYTMACRIFHIKDTDISSPVIVANDSLINRSVEWAAMFARRDISLDYFEKRGITEETCRRYQLFQMDGRAYFPIMEGEVCTGWCARAVDNDIVPRYKNSPGSLGLWNGDLLFEDGQGRELFVTEGIIDALCLEQMGFSTISLCGSQNINKLLRRCEHAISNVSTWRFVVCGDGDTAGRRMNSLLVNSLKGLGLSARSLPLPNGRDLAEMSVMASQELRELLSVRLVSSDYSSVSAADALDAFFEEISRRADSVYPSTGLPLLDRLLGGGLYPGLYVLGAISSLGKTSFALQLADCIAERGRDVLFVSLEQSRSELFAKSLSRISALLHGPDGNKAFTAGALLHGGLLMRKKSAVDEVRKAYEAVASHVFIREGFSSVGVAEIREMVREHREIRGEAPVVIVDYLQILRPADLRTSDKQSVDRSVVELKRISRDFDIPVIAISSLNRANYYSAVSMEAFKESGAVEYSADVLLGLQLAGAGSRDFDVNRAKLAEPRRVELVLLKNRSGLPYAKLPLRYFARYGLFESDKKEYL